MPIRKHLTDKTSFGPDTIEKMSKAFEEACIALQVFAGDEKGREIVATRIVDLATAQKFTAQVRATENRIAELEAENQLYRERSDRAEQWLRRIYSEIQVRSCAQAEKAGEISQTLNKT